MKEKILDRIYHFLAYIFVIGLAIYFFGKRIKGVKYLFQAYPQDLRLKQAITLPLFLSPRNLFQKDNLFLSHICVAMLDIGCLTSTLQGLSAKYKKPLSARFVSDGKTRINEKTDFQNQYLKDIIVRPLQKLAGRLNLKSAKSPKSDFFDIIEQINNFLINRK